MAGAAKRIWFALVDPVVEVDGLDKLRQSRLLAAILLVLLVISVPWEVFSILSWGFRSADPLILPAIVSFAILYTMTRRGKADIAGFVLVVIVIAANVATIGTASTAAGAVTYFYLLASISVASVLLSFRLTAIVVAACFGIAIVATINSQHMLSTEPYFVALILLVLISSILTIGVWHRNGLERDRLAMLAASQAEKAAVLAAIPDALFRF
ncbi:MAG: hypothetical protein HC802_03955 [Caldilineaceae bacterium]|nr:hypothetical protein [Caldilineaceae bacterium]